MATKRGVNGVSVVTEAPVIHVEHEQVQMAVTPEWVSAQVLAIIDPRGMNPKIVDDLATVLDWLIFSWEFLDKAQITDRIATHLQSMLVDGVQASDLIQTILNTGLSDFVVLSEAIHIVIAQRYVDECRVLDRWQTSIESKQVDKAFISDLVSIGLAIQFNDRATVSDSGLIVQHGYVSDGYVDLGYVGQISNF